LGILRTPHEESIAKFNPKKFVQKGGIEEIPPSTPQTLELRKPQITPLYSRIWEGNHSPKNQEGFPQISRIKSPRESDEDMTLMHTTMIGAWNGVEEVQQGFPSQEGGPRFIRFESPTWRPKAIQVRVQFGVQEHCTIKRTPRSHTESVLDVLYMVGSRIS
jgi:hypothetical protein